MPAGRPLGWWAAITGEQSARLHQMCRPDRPPDALCCFGLHPVELSPLLGAAEPASRTTRSRRPGNGGDAVPGREHADRCGDLQLGPVAGHGQRDTAFTARHAVAGADHHSRRAGRGHSLLGVDVPLHAAGHPLHRIFAYANGKLVRAAPNPAHHHHVRGHRWRGAPSVRHAQPFRRHRRRPHCPGRLCRPAKAFGCGAGAGNHRSPEHTGHDSRDGADPAARAGDGGRAAQADPSRHHRRRDRRCGGRLPGDDGIYRRRPSAGHPAHSLARYEVRAITCP